MLICSYILLPAFLALDLEVVAIAAEMGVLLCKNQSQREFVSSRQQLIQTIPAPSIHCSRLTQQAYLLCAMVWGQAASYAFCVLVDTCRRLWTLVDACRQ